MTVRMWGAAPRVSRILVAVAFAAVMLGVLSGTSSARVDFGRGDAQPATAPTDLWAVEINDRDIGMFGDKLALRARTAGLNAILIDERKLTTHQWVRVTRLVKHFGFRAVFLGRAVNTTKGAESACKRMKQRDHAKLCALVAPSWGAATKLAAAPDLDVVILRMQQLGGLKVVRDTGTRAKVLALVDIGKSRKLDAKSWRPVIERAGRDPSLDLAVSPAGSSSATAFTSYISLLGDADVSAPSVPTHIALVDAAQKSLQISWAASDDDHGVTEYGIYRSDVLVTRTSDPSVTLEGLACGTNYLIQIDAADAAGNRSGKASLQASTSPCPPPGGPAPADGQAPSTPTGLTMTASTPSTIAVAWNASSDNVGVAGYGLYVGPSAAGETPATTATFTGLTCGTQYSLAVDAYDASGNRSERAPTTAWTSPCPEPDTTPPTQPTGLAASVTATSITLSWDASSDDRAVAGYSVYSGGSLAGNAAGTSFTLTSLACAKSYTLSVDAYDANGNRSGQSSMTVSTGACPIADKTPPSTPAGLAATAVGRTSLTLHWNASTDNVGVGGYGVYVGALNLVNTASTTYVVAGLACGTNYTFGVDAYDAAGNRSGTATLTTSTAACPAPDTTPPSTPGSPSAAAATQNAITLTWSASTDNVGVSGYTVYNGASSVGSTAATSFTVAGLTCGTNYTLAVDAYDGAGNRSSKASVAAATAACPAADTTPPSAPAGLAVSSPTQTSITLSWSASSDNVAVTGYGRYRNGSLVFSGTGTSYTFAGLSCGTSYTLAVDAYDAAGNRSSQSSLTASTSACPDTQAPTAPAGLTASAATQTSITLSWNASSDNVGVTGYGRYRNGSLVTSGTGTSYTFAGLSCGTSYTLAVDAYDAAGNRSGKGQLTTSTSACPADSTPPSVPGNFAASGATQTSINLSWSASTDNVGVAGYTAYNGTTGLGNTTSTSFTVSGLTCGTSYSLGIDAYDAAGNRSAKAMVSTSTSPCPDTSAPTVPTNLVASTNTTGSITLAWTASLDNVGVAGYGVYNGSTGVGNSAATTYTVSGLTCGTGYTLAVDAYDGAGNRSAKAQVSASTQACPPPPPSGGSGGANLWVDPSGGSCVRQSSPAGYVDAQACSWNQAYQAAQTGDVILVKGGSYGNVTIGPNKASIAAPGVTFKTASGETVAVNDFENGSISGGLGGNNVTFVGPVQAKTFRSDRTTNITVDGWTVDCGGCNGVQIFHLENSTNVLVKNSDISDNNNTSLMWIDGTNLTFEGNQIHDAGLPGGSSAHTECMYAWDVTNLTLKRNHFYHCSVMDVFITGSDVANGGYVENNVFEKPWSNTGVISNSALAFHFRNGGSPSPDPNNWDFRYNTFVGPLSITPSENPVGSGGMRVIGNVFLSGAPCGQANTTYGYNAFVSGACGTNSITNSLATYLAGFASVGDPGTYSLLATSVLRDKGSTANYPSQDFTGATRYSGAAPDLGAYEYPG